MNARTDEFIRRASVFQSPSALRDLLEAHRRSMTKHNMFTKPENKILVEAWMAAMLGMGFSSAFSEMVQVRLCGEDQFPDFILRLAQYEFAFEATAEMTERPGVVYQSDESVGPIQRGGKRRPTPPFEPTSLERAVRKKVMKHYGSPVHLCVYLTSPGAEIAYDAVVRAVKQAGGDQFESVWVVTNDHMGCAKQWDRVRVPEGWWKIS